MKKGKSGRSAKPMRNKCGVVVGHHGRYRLELVKVRGKPSLRYVIDDTISDLRLDIAASVYSKACQGDKKNEE